MVSYQWVMDYILLMDMLILLFILASLSLSISRENYLNLSPNNKLVCY